MQITYANEGESSEQGEIPMQMTVSYQSKANYLCHLRKVSRTTAPRKFHRAVYKRRTNLRLLGQFTYTFSILLG
jgi:hypothetical protein